MKIVASTACAQWQAFVDGTVTSCAGRSAAGFDSTIVRIETDAGLTGRGWVCRWTRPHLPTASCEHTD